MADTSFVTRVTTIVAAWLNQVNKWTFWGRRPNYATTTGSGNAQVLTLDSGSLYSLGSEANGDEFVFTAGFTNTGATTLQVLPLGGTNTAAAVQLAGQALTGGEITTGRTYKVTRLGATWQLTNFTANTFVQSLLDDTTAVAARTTLGAVGLTGDETIAGIKSIADSNLLIVGSADATKKFRFEADGVSAGATRVLTVQDGDGTIAYAGQFQAPTGVRMLFQQTAAPVGWTKESSAVYNDAALRFTTGVVGTGGADAFNTLFGTAKSTAGFTLTTAEVPAHTHLGRGTPDASPQVLTGSTQGFDTNQSLFSNAAGTLDTGVLTQSSGGGGSHSHTLNDMNLKFIDVIVAMKD